MKIDILKHTIVNTVKSVSFWMKKPERKFFRTILENMLEYKTVVLSKLWNTDEKTAKKWLKYYSEHLWKSCWNNLWEKVEKIMVKFVWKLDSSNVFCFDSVDSNKNSAKKMEELKKVRDWSTWWFWNWYVWHWVSIKSIPLFLHRERCKKDEKDKWIRFEIFQEQVKKIYKIFWNWYWILADRLYDDFKKFKLLIKLWFNFVIRLKTNRNVEILEGKNKWKKIETWKLEEWKYTVKIKWVKQELYIFVKALKGQKKPIRVISNVNNEKTVDKYLERWEIERIFKVWKQEYDFEKVWTKSIQKTENLVYLVQLCLGISAYIFNKLNPKYEFWVDKNKSVTLEKIHKKIKPFLKRKSLTFNRNSITKFISYYMKFIRKMKYSFDKTILKPSSWLQLSLKV